MFAFEQVWKIRKVKLLVPSKKRQYAHKRYQNLTEEEKKQKARVWPWTLKNLSKEEKQKLVEYRKKILYKAKKNNCKVAQKGSSFLAIRVDKNAAVLELGFNF